MTQAKLPGFDAITVPPPVKHRSPPEILHARSMGRFVVFAGSGASMPTERPDWRGLIAAILKQCTAEELRDPRLKAAESLFDLSDDTVHRRLVPTIVKKVLGDRIFYNRLQQALGPAVATRAARYHNLLLNLEPRAIITTNYDGCFEMCTYESGKDWSSKIVEGLSASNPAALDRNSIYHLHGVERTPDSIIVGLGDYTRLYRRSSPALTFLKDLFENYLVLFVGCSMRDEEIIGELADSVWRHGHLALAQLGSGASAALKCLGIEVTEFDTVLRDDSTHSYRVLEDILSDWAIDLNGRTAGSPRMAV